MENDKMQQGAVQGETITGLNEEIRKERAERLAAQQETGFNGTAGQSSGSFAEKVEQSVNVNRKHRGNKVVYFALAFFLGALGVHKFYAGHIFAGLVFLILFFIGFLLTFVFGLGMLIIIPLELVALVQGIIGLCKTAGPDGLVEL